MMRELTRLRRLLALRTTQRDLSALRLQDALRCAAETQQQLEQADAAYQASSQRGGLPTELDATMLERLDLSQAAAREDRAFWSGAAQQADQQADTARELALRQEKLRQHSEEKTAEARVAVQRRVQKVEQQLLDERAGRVRRETR
mgnify:CR=1 FL=1